eukprot:658354-Prymnesium_polylepis.1
MGTNGGSGAATEAANSLGKSRRSAASSFASACASCTAMERLTLCVDAACRRRFRLSTAVLELDVWGRERGVDDVRGMEVRWRVCRAACGPVGGLCVCCCCPLCVRRLVLVLFHATAVLIYINAIVDAMPLAPRENTHTPYQTSGPYGAPPHAHPSTHSCILKPIMNRPVDPMSRLRAGGGPLLGRS